MPAIALVVCLYQERDLLARLLEKSAGCYDDLVVIHDGPDTANIQEMVVAAGGRFFERQREFQQEPHWPFAWEHAKCDWILRLDADEFPSEEMKRWLVEFRRAPEPPLLISGYTCIWPMWDGQRATSKKWPAGRNFLFNRQRVRFFGMVEQVPIADDRFEGLALILEHQPKRKTHTVRDLLRPRAEAWRQCIAVSLLGKPTDLSCWRWNNETWPEQWRAIRERPLATGLARLVKEPLRSLRDQWNLEKKFFPSAAINGPVHHALICLKYWRLRQKKNSSPAENK